MQQSRQLLGRQLRRQHGPRREQRSAGGIEHPVRGAGQRGHRRRAPEQRAAGLRDQHRGLRLGTVEELDEPHRQQRQHEGPRDRDAGIARIERTPRRLRRARGLQHLDRGHALALARLQPHLALRRRAVERLQFRQLVLQRLVLVEAGGEFLHRVTIGGLLLANPRRHLARTRQLLLRFGQRGLRVQAALHRDLAFQLGEAVTPGLDVRIQAHVVRRVVAFQFAQFLADQRGALLEVRERRIVARTRHRTAGGHRLVHRTQAPLGDRDAFVGRVQRGRHTAHARQHLVFLALQRHDVVLDPECLDLVVFLGNPALEFPDLVVRTRQHLGNGFARRRGQVIAIGIDRGVQQRRQQSGLRARRAHLDHRGAAHGTHLDHRLHRGDRVLAEGGKIVAIARQTRDGLLEHGPAAQHLHLGQEGLVALGARRDRLPRHGLDGPRRRGAGRDLQQRQRAVLRRAQEGETEAEDASRREHADEHEQPPAIGEAGLRFPRGLVVHAGMVASEEIRSRVLLAGPPPGCGAANSAVYHDRLPDF